MNKITKPFRKLFHKIRNLIYWFPIIWNDYDCHHNYFIYITKHKLESMHRNLGKKFPFVGLDEEKENIQECIDLFNKYLTEETEEGLSSLTKALYMLDHHLDKWWE